MPDAWTVAAARERHEEGERDPRPWQDVPLRETVDALASAHADRGALLAELARVTMKRDQYEQALYQSGIPAKEGEPDLVLIPECLVTLKAANTYLLGERENLLALVETLRGALGEVSYIADWMLGELENKGWTDMEDEREAIVAAKAALALVTPAAREERGD